MAACPSCGVQNPDSNRFCQACGKPLAAAAAPPPPAAAGAAPSPLPPAPAYQPAGAPYQPAGPAQVHRTPWGLIIGIVVGLVVLMSGCGVVATALVFSSQPSTKPISHTAPTPVAARTPVPTAVPSSAPTAAPTPVPTPTPQPAGGASTVSTKTFSLNAPGWKTLKKDDTSVTLLSPDGTISLFVNSGLLDNATSTQDQINGFVSRGQSKYGAKTCIDPVAEAHNGQAGGFVAICYVYTPSSGGKAFPAADAYWVSVSSDGKHIYQYETFSTYDDFDNSYNKVALPVIDSIAWKPI